MGIFDFFIGKSNKEEKKTEKIKIGNLREFYEIKKRELAGKEEIFLNEIKIRLEQLIAEFRQELRDLKEVDISNRKEEERLKLIVKENLKDYIYSFEKLIGNLESLAEEKTNSQELIKGIDELFISFSRKTQTSFEKATILIGNELGRVKESTSFFFRDFRRLIEENKETIRFYSVISLIEKYFSDIKAGEITENLIRESIKDIENKRKNLESEINKLEEEEKKARNSEEYKNFLETRRKREENEKKIKLEINRIRGLVDFKALQRIYHISEKKMHILKEFNEDFYDSFNKNNGAELIELMKEAKFNTEELEKKIKEIAEEKRKLIDEGDLPEDKVNLLIGDIDKLKEEASSIDGEADRESKRLEKLKEENKKIFEDLKIKLKTFDVELE